MKKILILVTGSLLFLANLSFAEIENGFSMGITGSSYEIDTVVKDDIDSNGTTTTTKNLEDTVGAGSVFGEITLSNGSLGVILGVDYIPISADLDKRSATQHSTAAAAAGAAPQVTGTNSGSAEITGHTTVYIQPGFISGSTMYYVTAGWVSADIEATVSTVTGSTITNKVQSLDGSKIGAGIKHDFGNGMYVKLDYADTDYDRVSYKTSTNSTTVTGDIDARQTSLSLGINF